MLEILNKPYPLLTRNTVKWRLAVLIGIFVALFLLVFQPFGLSEIESGLRLPLIGGFGLVTFIVVSLNVFLIPLLLPQWFREDRWKVINEILIVLWILFTVGAANLFYTWAMNLTRLTIAQFFWYQFITLSIGILPVALLVSFDQIRLLKQNLRYARTMNDKIREHLDTVTSNGWKDGKIQLVSKNERDILRIDPADLYYICSAQNYIEVFYHEQGTIRKSLIRNTLKETEKQLEGFPELIRCHRSYIVNLRKVIKVSGNSQGYQLYFEDQDQTIPASRNYAGELLKKL